MTRFFVSYSRSVKDEVRKVIDLLIASGHDVWWDGDIPIMADWWATILRNIEACEVFIFVVSEKSVQSAYCLAELKYANDRQCPILPFILDDPTSYTLPSELPPRGQWLIYTGDPAQMLTQINIAYDNIDWDQHRIINPPRPPEPMKGGRSLAQQYQEARRLANEQKFEEARQRFRDIKRLDYGEWGSDCDEWLGRLTSYAPILDLIGDAATIERARTRWHDHTRRFGREFDPADIYGILRSTRKAPKVPYTLLAAGGAVFAIALLGILYISGMLRGDLTPGIETPGNPRTAAAALLTQAANPTLEPTTAVAQVAEVPTLSAFQQVQTAEVERVQAAETRAATDLTSTVQANADRDATATVVQDTQTEAAALATLIVLSATSTPTPTLSPKQRAQTPVARNADWRRVERDFDDVVMVLVPTGCFMMGGRAYDDERPVHEQCFDQPFWIDKYEVTQRQFLRLGGRRANQNRFTGDDLPVERITWFEARDFCALRGARLPTEREWEYAARGPDNLMYPWGNIFIGENVVYSANSNGQTAVVGSRRAGTSWVGALDMAGNVWEWTSSLYRRHPYVANDGREDDANRTDARVLRGGSFYNSADVLRAPFRDRIIPTVEDSLNGFRCARSD